MIPLIMKAYASMNGSAMKGQRGGIAILTALGFLLFSVPLITGSLSLASTISIDAGVKTEILHNDYCGLSLEQYLSYLTMDTERWDAWLLANEDPFVPGTSVGTVDLCDQTITIRAVWDGQEPGDGDDIGTIPGSGYNQRDFQTTKIVDDANPPAGSTVEYTITIQNRAETATTLNDIRDTLPPGFAYDCTPPTPNQLTLPGEDPQDYPPDDPCPSGSDVEWDMPSSTSIESGAIVTLTFHATTSLDTGAYCNEVQVVPGGPKTSSGKTAIVEIGSPAAEPICMGEAVLLSQTMTSATYISTDITTTPFTYTFAIDYTITVENIGTEDLTLAGFIDLLPVGFSYLSLASPPGDITQDPSKLHNVSQLDRQRVTWDFSPEIEIPSGDTQTLIFSTIAEIGQGMYWIDLLGQFSGGAFPNDVYTWPTGVFTVRDVYDVTITDADGNVIGVEGLEVWMEGDGGIIASWDLDS